MRLYLLKILTPERKIYESKVISVTVTCENGQLAVLAGHAPMVAMLVEGPIVVRTAHETVEGVAGRGIIKVDHNETAVMVHSFKWAGDEVTEEPAADIGSAEFY